MAVEELSLLAQAQGVSIGVAESPTSGAISSTLGATPTDTQSRGLQLDGGPEDVVLATVAAAVDLLGRALTETAPDIDREAPR